MTPVRLRYQTVEFGETDIHLRTLRDDLQFDDPCGDAEAVGICSASWPLFGLLWASGEQLARLMFARDKVNGLRILEVGCGIGLASLVLNHRLADITATDHHPEAQAYLLENTLLNDDREIPFVRTAWADTPTDLGLFDLIIGADLLYERGHAEALSAFIDQHARHRCEVILVDPGRAHHPSFSKQMVSRGFSFAPPHPEPMDGQRLPFSGHVLRYSRTPTA